MMRWAGRVARMTGTTDVYRILVGNLDQKKLLGKPRRRCEDNIKTGV